MERCVDKLECICNFCYCLGILLLCLNNIKEFFVKVTAYDFKQAFFFCFVKRNKLNIVKYIVAVDCGNNNISRVRRKLSAVRTVYLVTVVFFRVVAGGNHNAGTAAKFANTE